MKQFFSSTLQFLHPFFPAKFLGMDGKVGMIKPGYNADIVRFDRELNVIIGNLF
jgi:N-acetylglucosamine-6-phosphate deacetylase